MGFVRLAICASLVFAISPAFGEGGGQQFGPGFQQQPGGFYQQPQNFNNPQQALGNGFNGGNPQMGNPNLGNPNMGNPNMGNPQMGNRNMGNPNMGNPNMAGNNFGRPNNGMDPRFGGQQQNGGFPQQGNNQAPEENYEPNVGTSRSEDGRIMIEYSPADNETIQESIIGAEHVMRHASEMLYTCSSIDANRARVAPEILEEITGGRGYMNRLADHLLLGANAPKRGTPPQKDAQGNRVYPNIGYAACWWIDELRKEATAVVDGLNLTLMIPYDVDKKQEKKDQVYPKVFANIRRMNIAAHEAIAASYFYVGTLHRTCFSDKRASSASNCPRNAEKLKGNLAVLEAKTYAARTSLEALRTLPNMSPFMGKCVECNFANYRLNPLSDTKQNYVPYPYYPAPKEKKDAGNPYVVYLSEGAVTVPNLKRVDEKRSSIRYDGVAWQQTWDTYDMGYLNPNRANATRVEASGVAAPRAEAASGLPTSNALSTPFIKQSGIAAPTAVPNPNANSSAPPANTTDADLESEPVPFGDVDPNAPLIRE